jgi:hypothetical protein
MVRVCKFLCKLNHHNGYIVLEIRGFLEYVNTSHIHDLAKFMFGFSVFGLTLVSQFMIWYANIPEEIYFITRIGL